MGGFLEGYIPSKELPVWGPSRSFENAGSAAAERPSCCRTNTFGITRPLAPPTPKPPASWLPRFL
jgi:hypothetical protein